MSRNRAGSRSSNCPPGRAARSPAQVQLLSVNDAGCRTQVCSRPGVCPHRQQDSEGPQKSERQWCIVVRQQCSQQAAVTIAGGVLPASVPACQRRHTSYARKRAQASRRPIFTTPPSATGVGLAAALERPRSRCAGRRAALGRPLALIAASTLTEGAAEGAADGAGEACSHKHLSRLSVGVAGSPNRTR